jgi:hypothetical protein
VIRCQGIPIDAVIKVRDGKGLLIGGYRRTASVCPSVWGAQARGGQRQSVVHFARARADAPIHLERLQIPCTTGQFRRFVVSDGPRWRTHITPWSRYVTSRMSSFAPKKQRERTMGSGSSPSSSGNLGGSGRSAALSQVAIQYLGQPGVPRDMLQDSYRPIVPCLITWTTLPEPMANEVLLCAMQ